MDLGLSKGPGAASKPLVVLAGLLSLAMLMTGCADTDAAGYVVEDCERNVPADHSVARVWNEALLDAVRRDFPAPTVHARNLFHVSAGMWDAWAAYDPTVGGYYVTEDHEAEDVRFARETAISYAAYRLLLHRYSLATGLEATFEQLVGVMDQLCYSIDYVATEGDDPAAFGNRIAATIIDATREDGSLEPQRYVDVSYRPVNDPMVVSEPGTTMRDPNRWQPLALEQQITQNGLLVPGSVQTFVGPNWGYVEGFALARSADGLPLDPGAPPYLNDPVTDAEFRDDAVDVVRYSALLDPESTERIDIGPAGRGNSTVGTDDGTGYDVNPATGAPYEPNLALHADYGRVIAEFWADGPDSETPPGHWNTLANEVSDRPEVTWQVGGAGPEVDRLEWDVKLYFALNGALHDAAIAAWGAKADYDYVRPISMIRFMGGAGQSSDPDAPAYHPEGLPLEAGMVEVVTAESSAPGQRHEGLRDHVGEIVVRAWRGNPDDPESEESGVGWIRAVEWVPYQRPSFVTPAFAGYVSGHSTFSRAGAEVMAAFTADEFFPGGLFEWTVEQGKLLHENGPSEDVTLQWATYADAADEAGISRLYGGIHVAADDYRGRSMGSIIGQQAWQKAAQYFDGSTAE
ncbi:MAG: vanadium-dependent haloperoxidase [Acidimicrobiia bacterium]|nr:vanadium-dependent haloperoxidase [Acidimicrobiia bacterium]